MGDVGSVVLLDGRVRRATSAHSYEGVWDSLWATRLQYWFILCKLYKTK